LFGKFLTARSVQIQNEARRFGIVIDFRNKSEVLDVTKVDEESFQIKTSSDSFTVNYVVLCTGHMPSTNYRELISMKGYWNSLVLTKEVLQGFDWEQDAVIIGSRLTAIDIALQLLSEPNFRGNVTMVSRNGHLPAVKPKQPIGYELKLKYLPSYIQSANGRPSLDTLLVLLRKEIGEVLGRDMDIASIIKSSEQIDALQWLDWQIAEAEESRKPWSNVLYAFAIMIQSMWHTLSNSDQAAFLKKYHSLFLVYTAGIPEEVAQMVRKHIRDGRLHVRGGLESISADEADQFIIQVLSAPCYIVP
jgi:uncharacterized NAD(P)/FAD-binding protein YdhS